MFNLIATLMDLIREFRWHMRQRRMPSLRPGGLLRDDYVWVGRTNGAKWLVRVER